jgi:hypothetical protein
MSLASPSPRSIARSLACLLIRMCCRSRKVGHRTIGSTCVSSAPSSHRTSAQRQIQFNPFRQGLRPAGLGGSRRPLPSGVRSDDCASARSWRLRQTVLDDNQAAVVRSTRRSSFRARTAAKTLESVNVHTAVSMVASRTVETRPPRRSDRPECEITEPEAPHDRTCHQSARCRRCAAVSLDSGPD